VDFGEAENLFQRVKLIRQLVVDFPDAGVDQHLDAVDARGVRYVDRAVFDAGAVLRRLRDGVDLGVDRAEAIFFCIAVGRLD